MSYLTIMSTRASPASRAENRHYRRHDTERELGQEMIRLQVERRRVPPMTLRVERPIIVDIVPPRLS